MQRRHAHSHRLVAIITLLLVAAACGEETSSPDATSPPQDTSPPDTAPAIAHPTGADDVMLRIGYDGGLVPADFAFLDLPALLVTGDGRVIVQGPQIEIYPGPLLPNILQRSISEAGIQALLQLAEEHGLFADVVYDDDPMIADAPDTVVTVTADGHTYEHRAYALGLGGDGDETDEARAALASFVAVVSDIAIAAGAGTLGAEQPFEAAAYLIRATVADPSTPDMEIPPTVVDWPAGAELRLADGAECATVPAESFRDLFSSANQLTWFVEDGVTYQLTVKPQLPGVPTC